MTKRKRISLLTITIYIVTMSCLTHGYAQSAADTTTITVPLGGNGWPNKGAKAKIDNAGLSNWTEASDKISVYVRVEKPGDMNIALKMLVPIGTSTVLVSAGATALTKKVSNRDTAIIGFGHVAIKSPGYVKIDLSGMTKNGSVFGVVSDVVLSGAAITKGAVYVKNNQGNYFYWGHRGPSVHLNYPLPDAAKNTAEWFYNEVTVPTGQDVLGSYFMADGFDGGYFGMQVNSATERHVLFSIWSPFTTDDPKKIPDSLKITMLKKGANVHTGEFGSEGSGGQSYLNYPWVAGKTYSFLIHAQADEKAKTTTFTAYFKEKGTADWLLIASFKRPKSGYYLKGLYSFLENFEPETGDITREVQFGNQWLIDTAGKWYPINTATFTADATAKINYRKDYSGGVQGNQFYLRNCGFFDDFTVMKSNLVREQSGSVKPVVEFGRLP